MKTNDLSKFDEILKKTVGKKHVFGATFMISSDKLNFHWTGSYGDLKEDSKFYIASINKLFISSMILKLIEEGKLSFDSRIKDYLNKDELKDLHIYKGIDYSKEITIKHLISHTSGLPCYLSDKPKNTISGMKALELGLDTKWSLKNVLERTKILKPHFIPGEKGRAFYSDTNHHLLSHMIKRISGKSFSEMIEETFKELNMVDTTICKGKFNNDYVLPYYKEETRDISAFLSSTENDIISTKKDLLKFLKAFFTGHFFDKSKLSNLKEWNNIFFPFKYGIGIQMFYMPRALSPFKEVPNMIGHCGSTGSIAFYIEEHDIYITGTTNQQSKPNIAFQTAIKLLNELV